MCIRDRCTAVRLKFLSNPERKVDVLVHIPYSCIEIFLLMLIVIFTGVILAFTGPVFCVLVNEWIESIMIHQSSRFRVYVDSMWYVDGSCLPIPSTTRETNDEIARFFVPVIKRSNLTRFSLRYHNRITYNSSIITNNTYIYKIHLPWRLSLSLYSWPLRLALLLLFRSSLRPRLDLLPL